VELLAMNDLDQLLTQRAELDAKIQRAQAEARDNAIAQVRELMARHGLTMADITARVPRVAKRPAATGGAKVPAKYRDQAGNTWSGRGLKPKWLTAALAQGAQLSDFAV
jgi:DNA-binding protein H-NS